MVVCTSDFGLVHCGVHDSVRLPVFQASTDPRHLRENKGGCDRSCKPTQARCVSRSRGWPQAHVLVRVLHMSREHVAPELGTLYVAMDGMDQALVLGSFFLNVH